VPGIVGFGLASDADMTRVSLESIYHAALEVCADDAELLFISCTALRSAQVVDRIERVLGVILVVLAGRREDSGAVVRQAHHERAAGDLDGLVNLC